MLNFDELDFPQPVEPIKIEMLSRDRYIIGLDPFESAIESEKAGSPKNVFTVYDKTLMRIVTRIVTTKSFEHTQTWYLGSEVDKKMFHISNKFVKDGRCKTIGEIRAENNIAVN